MLFRIPSDSFGNLNKSISQIFCTKMLILRYGLNDPSRTRRIFSFIPGFAYTVGKEKQYVTGIHIDY
jgi:hypothetical protein